MNSYLQTIKKEKKKLSGLTTLKYNASAHLLCIFFCVHSNPFDEGTIDQA